MYTVYYESEPVSELAFTKLYVDEIWNYSWHNIDMAIKPPLKTKSFSLASNEDAPLMRYVPVGFMKHEPTIKQFGSKPKLVFFGMKRYRPCYSDLENIMGDDLIDIYDVWDDDSFEKFLSRDYIGIFLNLHTKNLPNKLT